MTGYIRLLSDRWPALAFGFLAVFWGNFGQTFFLGVFSAPIQQSLGLTSGTYGAVYSLATLASAITVVWAGSLIDRVSLRRYTTVLCLGLALATFLMFNAADVILLAAGFYCLRLFGQALLPHTGMTTMARAFDDNRGKSLSVASSGVPVGEIVMPLLGVTLIGLIGWQDTFLALSLFLLVLVLPVMRLLLRLAQFPDLPEHHEPDATKAVKPAQARMLLLSDRRYWLALPGLMAPPFIVTGIFIHQDYVVASQGWTLEWFALCFVVYGTVHWLTSLCVGVLVDRFTAVRLLPFYLLPMALGLVALATLSGFWVAMLLMILMAMTIGSIPSIIGALWPEMYGVEHLGTIRSMNMALSVFATSLSPIVYGLCIDNAVPPDILFMASAAYVMLAAILIGQSYRAPSSPAD